MDISLMGFECHAMRCVGRCVVGESMQMQSDEIM